MRNTQPLSPTNHASDAFPNRAATLRLVDISFQGPTVIRCDATSIHGKDCRDHDNRGICRIDSDRHCDPSIDSDCPIDLCSRGHTPDTQFCHSRATHTLDVSRSSIPSRAARLRQSCDHVHNPNPPSACDGTNAPSSFYATVSATNRRGVALRSRRR